MSMPVLGIDVSKAKLDVELRENGKRERRSFDNTRQGCSQLLNWIKKQGIVQVHACMEATGRYWEAAAQALHAAGHEVSVVNPLRIKRHAEEEMQRNKTDGVDSGIISSFCAEHGADLRRWTPPAQEIKALREFYGRYDDLIGMRVQEINRLKSGSHDPQIKALLKSSISFLNKQIDQVRALIEATLKQHPRLHERSQLLESIGGIAVLTAGRLLAFEIDQFDDASAVAAYAGVTPRRNESGKTCRRTHISRIGHAELRRALYMPAMNSMRSNPVIKRLIERLRKNGLSGRQLVVAALHKLLHLAYGVLKTGVPFDPDWATRRLTPP